MSAYADPVGGAEIYMHGLADELERRGHVVGRFGTSVDREVDLDTTRIIKRPAFDPTRLVRDDAVTDALGGFIERLDPDILHVHNLYSLALDVDRLLAASDRPVVQTVHDYSIVCPNSWCVHADGTLCEGGAGARCFNHDCGRNYPYDAKMVLLTLIRHRLLESFMEAMICPSRYLADLLSRHGFKNVRHVFNYVDAEKLEAPQAEREERRLLYLGRLDPEKGVDILLDAMPLILAEEPETRLTVVGDGTSVGELRTRAERTGLGGAVTFHARVPYDRVKSFYATATLKILPSVWCENSPLTAYECMVAGLPMVGSRIGGIPDLVVDGETGALAAPRDPRDLARKELLRAPEARARMAENLRERVKLFTRKKNVDQVEEIYRDVLATDRRSRPEPVHLPLDEDLLVILHHLTGDLREREIHSEHLLQSIRKLEKAGPGGWLRAIVRGLTRGGSGER